MEQSTTVVETARLILRKLNPEDAEFIVELLNDDDFLRFIGDRGVRDVMDAERYILEGPERSYAENGFGLYAVDRKGDGLTIGICGLLRRPYLEDVDIGFAFLPGFRNLGYGFESAAGVLKHAREQFGLERVAAITVPENTASVKLLEKLGMAFERIVQSDDDETELMLFVKRETDSD